MTCELSERKQRFLAIRHWSIGYVERVGVVLCQISLWDYFWGPIWSQFPACQLRKLANETREGSLKQSHGSIRPKTDPDPIAK